ncbi:MAG: LacI family transcriptional regulator [Schleiferilactobacillus harbinensis]|jgi:LacI family transcriptional regulator|uniref:HTH lacI-type domain-containing protein n=1 Tax=Schleiferilactobacillus perolens DSM 12744 TaxID=1423792 RepID=A0A0R1N0B9_9LACO|nr:LacI family DNA-binding transcriptional regulator [Schleiferilactobacillus perolens]KRL13782.1 hypothetical protein FD09_GL001810 [Schleiferilactobacillus perolens DSM 12744]MCI1890545.1 LacI family transcriptional regulator [Schleiferilactobacillus harbinensis]MCI1911700.1 LacI family transcriptional regulator [Schleiferilactobacillus harbinensis]
MSHSTIQDIADKAGVSIATVSYALNGNRGVGEATRQRIKKIAKDIKYKPHMAAKIVASQSTPMVCGLVDSFSGVFNNELLDAVQDQFQAKGYSLLATNRILPDILGSDLFQGVIVFDFNISPEAQHTVEALNTPAVFLTNVRTDRSPCVGMDNQQAIELLYQEISQSKHRRLCILSGHRGSINNQERLATIKRLYGLNHPGADVSKHIYNGHFEFKATLQMGADLLKRYDAFLCFNDDMAMAIYQCAANEGLVVGRDISVTGFDNSPISHGAIPGLTTVEFDVHQWAKLIVDRFAKLVDMPQPSSTLTLVPPHLIRRESIAYA